MKPLVTWLKVKRAAVTELTLIEKVQNKVKLKKKKTAGGTTTISYTAVCLLPNLCSCCLGIWSHACCHRRHIRTDRTQLHEGQVRKDISNNLNIEMSSLFQSVAINSSLSRWEGGNILKRTGCRGFWWSRRRGRTATASSMSSISWTSKMPWATWLRWGVTCWISRRTETVKIKDKERNVIKPEMIFF